MTAIARSLTPLSIVRGAPFGWPMGLTNPSDGSPLDITGWTITATILGRAQIPVTVSAIVAGAGTFRVGGSAAIANEISPDGDPRLVVTATDSGGSSRIYVYPLALVSP